MQRFLVLVAVTAGLLLLVAGGVGLTATPAAAAYPPAAVEAGPPLMQQAGRGEVEPTATPTAAAHLPAAKEAEPPLLKNDGPAGGNTPTLTPCAGGTTFLNRSIIASDTPLPNRISQNGVASVCGTNKTFPGSIPVTGRHYDQYVLTNNSTISQCITVTLIDNGCGLNRAVMSAAYLGSFNPNNLATNYLADYGQSVNSGNPQGVYSFDVPAGQQFVIIVYDVGTVTDCTNYTLRVDACLTGGPTLTPTLTSTPTRTPTQTPCPVVTTITGSISNSDPTQAGRLTTGVISNCTTQAACPSLRDSNARHYDSYSFVNSSGQQQCLTVTLDATGCGGEFMAGAAYLGSYNPNNLCQNFLGIFNSTFNGTQSFAVQVPAGQQVVVVVYEAEPNNLCPSYTLTLRSCGPGGSIVTPTPTVTPCPPNVTTGAITAGDPTQAGRVLTGAISNCGTQAACPGTVDSNPRHYDAYVYSNTSGQQQCATITLNATGCGGQFMGGAAYLGSYNPNNLCQNYLGSFNSTFNGTQSFAVQVPAGQQVVVVVYEASPNVLCPSYTLSVQGCSISPAPNVLIGHLTWQGRPAPPNALNQLPLTLMLDQGGTTTTYPNQVADAGGFFTVPVTTLPTGVYTWWVKGSSWLATSGTVNLTGVPVTQQEMSQQRAGDVDNNNLVDITDFSLLRLSFGKACGDGGYDGRADFTGDCLIDITDFTLLRANFGQAGPSPP